MKKHMKLYFFLMLFVMLIILQEVSGCIHYVPYILDEYGDKELGRRIFQYFRCFSSNCLFHPSCLYYECKNKNYKISIDGKKFSDVIVRIDDKVHTFEVREDGQLIYRNTFKIVTSSWLREKKFKLKQQLFLFSLIFPVASYLLFRRGILARRYFLLIFFVSIVFCIWTFLNVLNEFSKPVPLC